MTIVSLILAGGKGERFWPKSRTNFPKQFLNISGQKSMIQQTVARLERLMSIDQVFIITNEMYAELIRMQIPHLKQENILIEPVGRNTAPCIGLAAIQIERKFPNSTMIVLPSDHIIKDEDEFLRIIPVAIKVASYNDNIVTLGITPHYPETGYGYLESMGEHEKIDDMDVHRVRRFIEKPTLEDAQRYIQAGRFYWNSGIFVWKTNTVFKNIKRHLPEVHDILSNIQLVLGEPNEKDVIGSEFYKMPEESIDYGIMEKADDIYVIPCRLGWDDVGSWTVLDRINERDKDGNVTIGNTLVIDTKRSIIESNSHKLIATLGIEDLIIIDTDDVTLICTKDKAQEVKRLLKELRSQQLEEYL
ncbi:mannose-1-phosphate guanylyltransferase [Paenibacillus sp. YIM B09110]|uniref:mannose-1-phosphate guanylyltransferase n=1 Tax=Paenibacillus sp. YIM B09110 TaxID=3126102 RepID=UPI00301BE887